MSTNETVSIEVAEAEFDRFALDWDLDVDASSMDEDDRTEFGKLKRRICRAIQAGRMSVDDECAVSYSFGWSKMETLQAVTFRPPTGDAVIRFDKYKDRQNVHKLNSYMGSMCGQPPGTFANMDDRDLKICRALVQLFLGS